MNENKECPMNEGPEIHKKYTLSSIMASQLNNGPKVSTLLTFWIIKLRTKIKGQDRITGAGLYTLTQQLEAFFKGIPEVKSDSLFIVILEGHECDIPCMFCYCFTIESPNTAFCDDNESPETKEFFVTPENRIRQLVRRRGTTIGCLS